MKKELIVFGKSPVSEHAKGREDNVIQGDPITNVWKYFMHPSGRMNVGVWDCQPGKWQIPSHPNNELCVITEGDAVVEDGLGNVHHLRQGDAFVLVEGMDTTWTVERYVKKIFVVVYDLAGEQPEYIRGKPPLKTLA